MYGKQRSRIEFLLLVGQRQILLEVKRNTIGGSVDEKLPFVYLTAKSVYPGYEYVLVMAGKGWHQDARNWIYEKARQTPGFTVVTPQEFLEWVKSL